MWLTWMIGDNDLFALKRPAEEFRCGRGWGHAVDPHRDPCDPQGGQQGDHSLGHTCNTGHIEAMKFYGYEKGKL